MIYPFPRFLMRSTLHCFRSMRVCQFAFFESIMIFRITVIAARTHFLNLWFVPLCGSKMIYLTTSSQKSWFVDLQKMRYHQLTFMSVNEQISQYIGQHLQKSTGFDPSSIDNMIPLQVAKYITPLIVIIYYRFVHVKR